MKGSKSQHMSVGFLWGLSASTVGSQMITKLVLGGFPTRVIV